MTAKPKQETAFEAYKDVMPNEPAPTDWDFETVADESPTTVIFDKVGDVFLGLYKGTEHIVTGKIDEQTGKPEEFDRFVFRGRNGELYAINQSYKLDATFEDIKPETWVRITYVKDIPTNRKLNPLKDFKVDVRK